METELTRIDYIGLASRETWDWLIENGYGGSDGASNVPDTIFGCRIGRTTRVFEWLPALIHDILYCLGRLMNLGEQYQQWADEYYHTLLLRQVNGYFTKWWQRPALYPARGICHVHYQGLRIGGSPAFTKAAQFMVPGLAAKRAEWGG